MPERMYIGGVSLELPYWGGISVRYLAPTVPSPNQVVQVTTVLTPPDLGKTPTVSTTTNTDPGFLDHVDPVMGIAGLIIGGALRLHPATAGAALFVGVGLAVLNWGSEPAGADDSNRRVLNDPSALYMNS